MREGPFTGQPQGITPGWKNGSEFIVKNFWACELSLDQVIQHAKCFTDDRKGLATATLTSPLKNSLNCHPSPTKKLKTREAYQPLKLLLSYQIGIMMLMSIISGNGCAGAQ